MNRSGSRIEKQRQVNEFINLQVVRLAPGEALPPLRQLIRDSGFGQVMLQNSIRLCVERGVLEARPRQGFFRTATDSRRAGHRVVDIIACSENGYMEVDGFMVRLIQFLFRNGTDRGYSMRIHRSNFEAKLSTYAELVRNYGIRSVFLVSPDNPEIARSIREQCAMAVEVMPTSPVRRGPAVEDSPHMVDLQMDYLFSRGHRRIALLHEDREGQSSLFHVRRTLCYYRRMAEAGLKVLPEYVADTGHGGIGLQRTLERMFRASPPPTAVICNELWLPQLYTFFAARNMVIGRDISVISDGEEKSRLEPPPTLIRNSQEEIAALAWELMERLLAGNFEERILFPNLTLCERHTVNNKIR